VKKALFVNNFIIIQQKYLHCLSHYCALMFNQEVIFKMLLFCKKRERSHICCVPGLYKKKSLYIHRYAILLPNIGFNFFVHLFSFN